ncbi:vacuole protein [Coprinopsis cinerea okayama7|uniref:Phosphatidylglycerol/phosphatidylinositol transfer protein n=1 Tax=Coprinopsis cinerea (strain Okayama-7 / 130 / ATCC MYA-4618 / FGSC 9003) TaxID=240176 RepID=A8N1L4_COPC7|nr:vacuole protein [Coprinopsis cinerea okayama7\|eukprot:XP_001828787.1 vacuole protein [Coprinopsis cinerea okayama7\
MRLYSLALLLAASSSLANPIFTPEDQAAFGPLDAPVTTTSDKWAYEDCGREYDLPIEVLSLDVFPDPPKPGKDMTVKVKAKVAETIEEGTTADVVVKTGLIKLLDKTFDVCKEARDNNVTVQCPVEPGVYEIEQTVALPREVPRAKFHVNIEGYSPDDDPLLCLKLMVDFMIPFPRPRKLW